MMWRRRRKPTIARNYEAEIVAFQRQIDIAEDLKWRDRLPEGERCAVCGGLGYRYFGGDSEAGPAERVPCDVCHVSGRAS